MNIKTFFLNTTFLCFVLVFIVSCSSTPAEKNYKQLFKGVGYNLEEAKTDAIRSALSLQIPQYVLADRLVINSELKKDSTISTSSGFIRNFSVEDQYIDENGFVVVIASISVSKNKIKDYAAKRYEVYSVNTKSDQFDGERQRLEVLAAKSRKEAEKLRRQEQYKAAVQLTDRLFAGYPFNTVEVNVTNVEFDPDNEQFITIYYEYDLNEEWRKSFWNKLQLIEETLYDSGERLSIAVCPNSGTILENCRRIPASAEIPFPLLRKESTKPTVVIPSYNKDGKFEECLLQEIIPPVGQLTQTELEALTGGQILFGTAVLLPGATAAIAGATVAGVAIASVGIAGVIASIPLAMVGIIDYDDLGDSIDDVENFNENSMDILLPLDSEWETTATIYVLGPNPTSTDFQGSSFSAIKGGMRLRSETLYSETKAASIFKPFVTLSLNNGSTPYGSVDNFYFDVTSDPEKFTDSGSFITSDDAMCKYGGNLR